jgi:hypothetical protein
VHAQLETANDEVRYTAGKALAACPPPEHRRMWPLAASCSLYGVASSLRHGVARACNQQGEAVLTARGWAVLNAALSAVLNQFPLRPVAARREGS